MKAIRLLVFMCFFVYSASYAETKTTPASYVETAQSDEAVNTVLDIPLRLGGFIATIAGTGLFLGTLPITALMTAAPPHNAIEKSAEFFIVTPANYTFSRPTGLEPRNDDPIPYREDH